jgi:hypothetical protein
MGTQKVILAQSAYHVMQTQPFSTFVAEMTSIRRRLSLSVALLVGLSHWISLPAINFLL